METLTFDYFEHYFAKEKPYAGHSLPVNGHVITLSRDYGCGARELALKLQDKLNEHQVYLGYLKSWKVIDQEVLQRVGEELKINLDKVTELSTSFRRGVVERLLASAENYEQDMELKLTLEAVIAAYLQRGNVILIGRGAGFYTQGQARALNVRLTASPERRAMLLAKKRGVTEKEALKRLELMDDKRRRFLEFIAGGASLRYDVQVSMDRVSADQVVEMIYGIMKASITA